MNVSKASPVLHFLSSQWRKSSLDDLDVVGETRYHVGVCGHQCAMFLLFELAVSESKTC
jgi:hypothetical protein